MNHATSVGSIIKKLMEVNPTLSAKELMEIIRSCVEEQGGLNGEFTRAEKVNEEKAIELAKSWKH